MVTLPGFEGRIGRLAFLGRTLGSLFVASVTMVVMIFTLGPDREHQTTRGLVELMVLVGVTVLLPFWYYVLGLNARRFRDIGWSPLVVIPGWFAIDFLDSLAGYLFPSMALAHGGTPFGALVTLFLSGALLLWPGQPEGPLWGGDYHDVEPRPVRQRAVPVDVPARAARQAAPQPAGFGRRVS